MKNIASILLIIFVTFIVAPTTVVLIKSTADISFVFTINEEENNERVELKDKQVQLSSFLNLAVFSDTENHDHFYNYKDNYKHIYFEVLSPPPERV